MSMILIALDGSERGKAAIDAVRQLIGPTTRLVLFTVLPVPRETARGNFVDIPWRWPGLSGSTISTVVLAETRSQAMDRLRATTLERLDTVAWELRRGGAEVTSRVAFGEPVEQILAEAEQEGAALIAVASHGLTGRRETLLGSVAAGLIRAARLPVLVAPVR